MKIRCLGGIVCGLILTCNTWADTIANLGGSSGSWQPFPGTLTEGNPQGAYWDNRSQDGAQMNVGYFLTGQTAYPNSPNLSSPQWLGNGSGGPSGITFNSTGPSVITLLLKATANSLEFGYFDAANPTNTVALLTTADAVGTQIAFTSSFAAYGFYIRYLSGPNDVYKSVTSNSTGSEIGQLGATHQHFTVFAGAGGINSGNYIVGAEDKWGLGNPNISALAVDEVQGDYQDFVIGLSVLAVPEPSTFGLVGLALLGASAALRRRR